MINRISEDELFDTVLIGESCKDSISDIKGLIDIVFGKDNSGNPEFEFFDIKGTVLLYGTAGVGKTTIARNCMNYAIDKYGVDSYTLNVSDIIVSGLGETVSNIAQALDEFEKLRKGILFIDEIDKLFISRESPGEISELKRLLIEFMGYIDNLSVGKEKLLIGCTNVYDQLDKALVRRFAIRENVNNPDNQEKNEFFNICIAKAHINSLNSIILNNEYLSQFTNMDSIKALFRKHILNGSLKELEGQLQQNIKGEK